MINLKRAFVFLAVAVCAPAQVFNPTVLPNGVVNVASYGLAGLPSGDIAQGSMVVVFGTNFGPSVLVQAATYPLPTTLAGTSGKVTSGGVTKDLILIYTSASQLAAIIPSGVPAGKASITVSYNGRTSIAQPFTMVTASFGIFTSNTGGSGPGIIADPNSVVYTTNKAAHPGDIGVIWGTGLGSVTGDEAAGPRPGDLTGSPVQVFVGGQQVKLAYKGRSGCCAGIDQIVFTVPDVVGCRVPVIVVNNQAISNSVSMPIASAGNNTCSDSDGPVSADVQRFTLNGGSLASLVIARTETMISYADSGIALTGSVLIRDESLTGTFFKFSSAQLNTAINPFATRTPGTCSVFQFTGPTTVVGELDPVPPVSLDAGASLKVVGSGGTKSALPLKVNGLSHYFGDLFLAAPPAPGFLEPGNITVSGGGASAATSVGTFQTTIATAPPLVWTNMNPNVAMNFSRYSSKLITWTGGDPAGKVTIYGQSATNGSANAVGAAFTCTAKASDGQFTIPDYILSALPVTGSPIGLTIGSLSVSTSTVPQKFGALGIDAGYTSATFTAKRPVKYQ